MRRHLIIIVTIATNLFIGCPAMGEVRVTHQAGTGEPDAIGVTQIRAALDDRRSQAPCGPQTEGNEAIIALTAALAASGQQALGGIIISVYDRLSPQERINLENLFGRDINKNRSVCRPVCVGVPQNINSVEARVYVWNKRKKQYQPCGLTDCPGCKNKNPNFCPAGWSRVESPPAIYTANNQNLVCAVVANWGEFIRDVQLRVWYQE